MNLNKIIRCLVVNKPNEAGTLVGHSLLNANINELIEARDNLIRFNGPNKYTEGYVAALQDVIAAYQTALEEESAKESNLATATKAESIEEIDRLIGGTFYVKP